MSPEVSGPSKYPSISSRPDGALKFGLNATDTVPVVGSHILGLTSTNGRPIEAPVSAETAWKLLNTTGPQVIVGEPVGGAVNKLVTVARVKAGVGVSSLVMR